MIPDKRYCFDHFLPESVISEVVEAFEKKFIEHTIRNVIEHRALITHNDAAAHWRGEHGEPPETSPNFVERVSAACDEYHRANGAYIDVHAWQFTPASFHRIVSSLRSLGLLSLLVENVFDTPEGSLEFCAVLTKADVVVEGLPTTGAVESI